MEAYEKVKENLQEFREHQMGQVQTWLASISEQEPYEEKTHARDKSWILDPVKFFSQTT